MTKGEKARQNFLSGLNCSEAVVLAFKDEIGIEEKQLKGMATGFGGGMARLRLTCGAVSGMCMVLSSMLSRSGADKAHVYEVIQSACGKYVEKAGSLICGELLSGKVKVETSCVPEERTPEYYKKRPCAELCQIAGDICEEYIKGLV